MSSENKKLKILSYVACFMVLGAFAMVLFYAPIEQNMGIVQKVFFFHVSAAWIGMLAFLVAAVCGILYLTKKRMLFDPIAFSAVEIGLLFTAIANFSGMIWAKPIWNTWWTWDPRLSTTLVMWFVYAGYLVLRSADVGGSKGAKMRAVLGIVAFLDVPLVFLSARLWRSIHPAVLASRGGGLEPEMWTAVWINVLAWGALFATLVLARYHGAGLKRRVEAALIGIQEKTLQ